MAEEKKTADNQESTEKPKKSSNKLIIIIVASITLFLFLLFTLGVILFLSNRPEPDPKTIEEEVMGIMVPMREYVVNLLDFGGRRFLKVEMELEVDNQDVIAEIELKNTILRNYIINILSSKSFKDVNTVEGKNYLRKSIILRCNFLLKKGKVLNVYFKDFIIQ